MAISFYCGKFSDNPFKPSKVVYNSSMTANTAQTQQSGVPEGFFFGDICLLGFGVTGRAVLEYFLKHPGQYSSLAVYGASDAETSPYITQKLPNNIAIYNNQQEVIGDFDLAVASPGIPPHTLLYQSAQRCAREIISEPELAWRISPERWIAVTGTNGKTTTTTLIQHLLKTAGIPSKTAGNIGNPCIETLARRELDEYLVVELSSYQLFSTAQLAPGVAVLLGITPDHLSWHGSHEDYEQSKLKLLANLDQQSFAVIDATQDTTRSALRQMRDNGNRVLGIGTADGLTGSMVTRCGAANAAYLDENTQRLMVIINNASYELCRAEDLKILGMHNLTNALAAAAVALYLGASSKDVIAGLTSFQPLEHRFEPCGEVGGIRFYNDSKATNIDASIKAVEAFGDSPHRHVVMLLGGRDKDTDLSELVAACSRCCHTVICFGEAAPRFFGAFNSCDAFATIQVENFKEACDAAVAHSTKGDVVLLSPACASFDEFPCFEERGFAFKNFVANLDTRTPPWDS